jgi:hypothetical protein
MSTESDSGSKLNVSITPLKGVKVTGDEGKLEPVYYVFGLLMGVCSVFVGLLAIAALPSLIIGFIGLACISFALDPYFDSLNVNIGNLEPTPFTQMLSLLGVMGIYYISMTYTEYLVIDSVLMYSEMYQVHIALVALLWISGTSLISDMRGT